MGNHQNFLINSPNMICFEEIKKIINSIMIKNFLIINCTGKNDKIGLKINSNFFIHDFQTQIENNEILVSTILNLTNKHKVKIDKDFAVLVNNGPGRFSTIRVTL